MSDESGLIEFWRARLDEDEGFARSVHGRWDDEPGTTWWNAGEVKTVLCDDQIYMHDAEHIARHGPARVLAEIAAKRETIRMYEDTLEFIESLKASGMKYGAHETAAESYLNVIRNGAAVHREHPDYLPAWAVGVHFI